MTPIFSDKFCPIYILRLWVGRQACLICILFQLMAFPTLALLPSYCEDCVLCYR